MKCDCLPLIWFHLVLQLLRVNCDAVFLALPCPQFVVGRSNISGCQRQSDDRTIRRSHVKAARHARKNCTKMFQRFILLCNVRLLHNYSLLHDNCDLGIFDGVAFCIYACTSVCLILIMFFIKNIELWRIMWIFFKFGIRTCIYIFILM